MTTEENMVSVHDSSVSDKTLGLRSNANTNPQNNGGDFCGDDTAKNLIKGFGNYHNNVGNQQA